MSIEDTRVGGAAGEHVDVRVLQNPVEDKMEDEINSTEDPYMNDISETETLSRSKMSLSRTLNDVNVSSSQTRTLVLNTRFCSATVYSVNLVAWRG